MPKAKKPKKATQSGKAKRRRMARTVVSLNSDQGGSAARVRTGGEAHDDTLKPSVPPKEPAGDEQREADDD